MALFWIYFPQVISLCTFPKKEWKKKNGKMFYVLEYMHVFTLFHTAGKDNKPGAGSSSHVDNNWNFPTCYSHG